MPISNQQLRDAFLSSQMRCYLASKLPELAAPDLEARIDETLKFLNIAAFCKGNIPVTQEIDDVWHYWILETQEYERLCGLLQGGKFIHHRSNAYQLCAEDPHPAEPNELEDDIAVLGTYVLNYGPFEADRTRYWILANHLIETGGMTVEQLNEWLVAAVPSR